MAAQDIKAFIGDLSIWKIVVSQPPSKCESSLDLPCRRREMLGLGPAQHLTEQPDPRSIDWYNFAC